MPELKKQKKPRRWKGRLAKKIRPQVNRPRGLAVTDADTVAKANKEMERLEAEAIAKEYEEKLALPMKDYMKDHKIEENDYFSLALLLAIEHIPGFQLDPAPLYLEHDTWGAVMQGKKMGRHTVWTPKELQELVSAVEDAKKKLGFSKDRDALSHLAQHRKWAPPVNHRGDLNSWIKTLQNKLGAARKL